MTVGYTTSLPHDGRSPARLQRLEDIAWSTAYGSSTSRAILAVSTPSKRASPQGRDPVHLLEERWVDHIVHHQTSHGRSASRQIPEERLSPPGVAPDLVLSGAKKRGRSTPPSPPTTTGLTRRARGARHRRGDPPRPHRASGVLDGSPVTAWRRSATSRRRLGATRGRCIVTSRTARGRKTPPPSSPGS